MADAKISDLTELTQVANDDLLPIVDVSAMPATTKKITVQNLRLRGFVFSQLNTGQATGNTNGTFTTMNFNLDYASVLASIIDRPTASQFRALIAGWYRITYQMYGVPSANDRGAEIRLIKNGVGTALSGSTMRITRANATLGGFGGKIFAVQLAANDYIELQAAPLDASIVTFSNFSNLSFELIALV
jgi:hypothetical protein